MTNWKKAKILIVVIGVIIFGVVGYDIYDPYYITDKRVPATVIRSIQKVERYSSDFKEIVVETSNGQRYTFRVQSSSEIKEGDKVELKVMMRIHSKRTRYIL